MARYVYIQCAAGPGPLRLPDLLDDWEIVVNCLSYRVLTPAVVSMSVALCLLVLASGAAAGVPADSAELATADAEPSITFTGSAIAPLVCTSKPDTGAIAITEDTRVTLANFTGAAASIDTGTAQELAVADGSGVSVRFRPGEYTVRMVPSCTLTSTVGFARVTVTAAQAKVPPVTPTPSAAVTPPPSGGAARPTPQVTALPSVAAPSGAARVPPTAEVSGAATHPAVPSPGGGEPGGTGGGAGETLGPRGGGIGPPSAGPYREPTEPGGSGAGRTHGPAQAAAGGPVIYDVLTVAVPQPGDPRDARLLAVIAIICVFGVSSALIRAILSQRARRMVSTY